MPLNTDVKRRAAMEIVLAEEAARGYDAKPVGAWAAEKKHGCDVFSMPPGGAEPDLVEVKGWGEPLRTAKGSFTYPQDIRKSQFDAAAGRRYRVEIVANLDAHLAVGDPYERLTLTGEMVRERAVPRLYDIPLEGLEDRVWRQGEQPLPVPTAAPEPMLIEWTGPEPGAGMEGDEVDDLPRPPDKIATSDLRQEDVPPADATWARIQRFALTFDGYGRFGDHECGPIANLARDFHDRHGYLPQLTLDLARGCLFYEQRRWRHFGFTPDKGATVHIRALVEAIRAAVDEPE